jgi:hypothetical protein
MTPNEKLILEVAACAESENTRDPWVIAELFRKRGLDDLADVVKLVPKVIRHLERKAALVADWPLVDRRDHVYRAQVIGEILQFAQPHNPHYRWKYISSVDGSTGDAYSRRQAVIALETIFIEMYDKT